MDVPFIRMAGTASAIHYTQWRGQKEVTPGQHIGIQNREITLKLENS